MSIADATHRPKKTKDSDFYQTPEIAVHALFEKGFIPTRNRSYHDPCCGHKAIGNVFRKRGVEISEDDIEISGNDFLKDFTRRDVIIANPPYSLKNEFIDHAMEISSTVIMILPANVISYQEFHARFLDIPQFHGKLKMSPKFYMTKEYQIGIDKLGGVSAYAWFMWDRSCNTDYSIEWYCDLRDLKI